MNFWLCKNNSIRQELDDCDLCVEFAHFLSTFITLERKKEELSNKTTIWCLAFILPRMDPVDSNTQGNLITGGHWIDVTFAFCNCLYSQRNNRKLNIAKSFLLMVTFYENIEGTQPGWVMMKKLNGRLLAKNIKNCKLLTTRTVVFNGQTDEWSLNWENI